MKNDAMFGGLDLVRSPQEWAVSRCLAQNHLLLYPEMLPVLRFFAPPGSRKAAMNRVINHFVFCRKVNAVVGAYMVDEGRALGFLAGVDTAEEKYELKRPPAPAIAYFVVDSYLKLSDGRLDCQVARSDAEMQVAFVIPGVQLGGSWQQQLREGEPLLRLEVGESRVRLTREDFLWLVRHRLVEPPIVARVLNRLGAAAAAAWLQDQLRPRILKLSPENADAYLAAFG
jgi:hypothetical protein